MSLKDLQFSDSSKTLGRGLGSLIPNKSGNSSSAVNSSPGRKVTSPSYLPKSTAGTRNQILQVDPSSIQMNPFQPRKEFRPRPLENLKRSIAEHGILQPLVVTQTMAGKYELLAGERRLRASIDLGLKKVPIIVRNAKDLEKLELSLIENIQREDLNPIEKAEAYKNLIDSFNLTQEEASKRLGIPRSTLNNALRLLTLPSDIQISLASGELSEGQAKLILSLQNENEQVKIFKKTRDANLTVKEVEKEVRKIKVKSHTRVSQKNPRHQKWEDSMQTNLGTRVKIRERGKKGGVLEIEFYSEEELEGIVERILGE